MKNIICRFLLLCLLSVSSVLGADAHQDFLDFNLRRFSYIGDIVKVKKALDLGAKIDSKDDEGMNALMWAALKNREDVVKFLIEKGADTSVTSGSGRSILNYAVQNENDALVKYLLSKKVPPNLSPDEANTVFEAVSTKKLKSASLLLPFEKDKNRYFTIYKDNKYRQTDTTLLLASINAGNIALAKEIISDGADINLQNSRGETPLLCAMRNGFYDFAQELIDMGANKGKSDIAGNTLLSYAIKAKQQKLASEALEYIDVNQLLSQDIVKSGPELYEVFISAKKPGDLVYTYLQMAALYGDTKIAKELLKKGLKKDELIKTDYLSLDALGIAVLNGEADTAKFLIEDRAKVFRVYKNANYQGELGTIYFSGGYSYYTLLDLSVIAATVLKKQDMLNYLLERDDARNYALIESDAFYKNVVIMLLSADDSSDEYVKLYKKIEDKLLLWDKERYIKIKTALLKKYEPTKPKKQDSDSTVADNSPKTLIKEAIKAGDEAKLRRLAKDGISISKEYPEAIHIAIMYGKSELIETLVDLGVDINKKFDDDTVPIMLMRYLHDKPQKLQETLSFVISKGADINTKSVLLDYCLHKNMHDRKIADLLLKNQADFGATYYEISRLFESSEVLDFVLADDRLAKALVKSISKSDATQIAIQLIRYGNNQYGVEKLFELAYKNNIKIDYRMIFNYPKVPLKIQRCAMFYMDYAGW